MADQSRWFIKEKPLEDRIKACKKSLEAAVRSQRGNIAEALRAKLATLEAERTSASKPSGRAEAAAKPAVKPAKAKRKVKTEKKVKGKVASASPETCSAENLKTRLASADEKNAAIIDRPATKLNKKKSSKASKSSTLAESSRLSKKNQLDSSKVSKQCEKSESKTPKSKSKKPSSIAPSDRATAIEVLLRAATAAKAARRAAGEESEEEAPLPELPMPRKDFSASNGMAMTATDVEEMESEEPAEDDDGERKAPKHQETDEDEDFFDSVEDPMPVEDVEAEARGNQTASLRGAARRAKKQRRKERLELIREEPLLKHPSWVAQKSPRVSGAFSTVKGKKGKRTTFASDSE